MKRNRLKSGMIAMILSFTVMLSMTAVSFAEAFEAAEGTEALCVETETDAAAGLLTDAEEAPEERDLTVLEEEPEEPDLTVQEEEPELPDMMVSEEEPAQLQLSVTESANRVISVSWEAAEGAEYYTLALDQAAAIDSRTAGGALDGQCYSFKNVDPKKTHSVSLKAYRGRTKADGAGESDILVAEKTLTGISASVDASTNRKTISKKKRTGKSLGINLRKRLGEKPGGYSVVQGGACDGTYAYYLMVSSSNQNGRVLKLRMSDNAVVAKSAVIDINHGNGMALDTVRHRLVVVGRNAERNQLTLIDVGQNESDVPKYAGHVKVKYKIDTGNNGNGLSAISYVEKYDCYIALQRKTHDLLVLDAKLRVIGFIGTTITAKYPGTYQAMDADERYVYLLLSEYQEKPSKQPYNMLLVLDWNSGNMVEYANKGTLSCSKWCCSNNKKPVAAIRINTPYEAENVYHVDNGDGTARFYMSEYNRDPKYRTEIRTKKYKVKWKKVKKKVKWKKVKTKKGKWKWKYRTKKVWKYKTKYKKVKVKVLDHFNRKNYVYYLGKF